MRVVKANDLDLTLFQFDYGLTFAVIFMNADKTVYGRYGSRSSLEDAAKDISVAGLAESMAAASALHKGYPANKKQLEGKQSLDTEFKIPNDFPSLRGKFKEVLDYQGAVTRNCMHCHQVRDAERQIYRSASEPIPDQLMFPNPSPAVVGLALDPRRRATVTEVQAGSRAEISGFKSGDEILELDSQAILSQADIQWVLHNATSADTLDATIKRGDKQLQLRLILEEGWRHDTNISWRESSWGLRRRGTGGILFEPASADHRRKAEVTDGDLALIVKHMGSGGGPHGAAKRARFKLGDMVVSFNNQNKHMTTSQLLVYAARNTRPGQQIPVTVFRGGKRIELKLPMQD